VGRIAPHTEKHFSGSETVRDVVIGMSDGLTVPIALAAGLAGAVSTHVLIVIGGLAEMAAGSIAMGMGGFLAARSDAAARVVGGGRAEATSAWSRRPIARSLSPSMAECSC